MMIRIGKPEGFMMVSPSKKQVSYPELGVSLPYADSPVRSAHKMPSNAFLL